MVAVTSLELVQQLRLYRLLEPDQLEEVERTLSAQNPDPKGLARELMKRCWLSPYQANQLFLGRGKNLIFGSYILVERLGGGGMGEVFKARNWKLGYLRALKLVRKERIADEMTALRFRREIRAAAQLTHPNIVGAYDADEVDGTHYLVMEYVEGTDLSKLVKVHGPLPVDQACDFIRQAACGLQHAFEQGMVHRDIKPHNLLLTKVKPSGEARADGNEAKAEATHQIKILDMGLARVVPGLDDGNSRSLMTQEGMIMGTPDYIAPEQARESHSVDIRADLYSLGCTFFFLLTGTVPFPKGSLIQKLTKHQFDEPPSVESLRPDVPVHISAIVRKLLAKQPDDRFQTPAELAAALTGESLEDASSATAVALSEAAESVAHVTPRVPVPKGERAQADDTAALWSSIVTPPIVTLPSSAPQTDKGAGHRSWRWVVLVTAGLLFVLVGFLLWQR